MPGCKLQLLEGGDHKAGLCERLHPSHYRCNCIYGYRVYTQLNSQQVVKLKLCIPQTATHPASVHELENQTHPQAQI